MSKPISNPPNPWDTTTIEWLGPPPDARLEVFEEEAKSILSANDSPDLPFRYSLNAYRGCTHACAYCYARRSHQFLGFGAGTDFDRKIIVKRNAAELLAKKISSKNWKRDVIAFSGNTDCYQPLEVKYELTRRCLETCLEFNTPVGIITKSNLVRRDIDLLTKLARGPGAQVHVSIPFLDAGDCRKVEPGTPTPSQRFETIRQLSEAGITTALAMSPMIPGLNDHAIPGIVERAARAGASTAFISLLRLSAEVRQVFEERLNLEFPDRAARVMSALDETRRGQMSANGFGARFAGSGPRWEAIQRLFEIACQKHGLDQGEELATSKAVRRPAFELIPKTARRVEKVQEPARGCVQGKLFDS
ncbi:MAG: DNA repair photolyase [Planctomycetota bacterium]